MDGEVCRCTRLAREPAGEKRDQQTKTADVIAPRRKRRYTSKFPCRSGNADRKYEVSICVWKICARYEKTNNAPASAKPFKLERRAAQIRIVALTAPFKSMAADPDMNPVSGIFSMMNCGIGEMMLAAIMLRMKAMKAPIHCRKRERADLNEMVFMAGVDLSEMVFMRISLFLKICERQCSQPKAEHADACVDVQRLERAHHDHGNAHRKGDAL